ncbi:MAG: hypothetical protein U0169_19605 [Polyangiaceae bacterium]
MVTEPAVTSPLAPLAEDVTTRMSMGPTASVIVAYGFGFLAFAALALYAHHRFDQSRRRERHAKDVAAGTTTELDGLTTAHGVVSFDDGQDAAVRVAIHQDGVTRKGKHGPHHSWSESRREITLRPFYLLLDGGSMVRVEPEGRTVLVDDLDAGTRTGKNSRVRVAELSQNEAAYVTGEAVRGFNPRAADGTAFRGGTGMVLGPPKGQPMFISTRPLTERHAQRASFFRGWRNGIVAAILLFQGVVFAKFTMLQFFGENLQAPVTANRYYTTRNKSSTVPHYEITVRVDPVSGSTSAFELDLGDYERVVRARSVAGSDQPVLVPIRVAKFARSVADVGHVATIHVGAGVLVWVVLGGLAVGMWAHGQSRRPWYLRDKVNETGTGKHFPDADVS